MRPVGYGPAARPARVFVDGREPSGEHVRSFRNSCLEFRTGVGQRRGERKKKWDACRLGMARPKVWEQRRREGRGGRKERRDIKRRWKDKGRGFWARSVAGWKREREGWKNASEPRYGLTGAPVLQRRCTSRISERPDSSWDIQRTEYPDRLYDFPFCHGCPSPLPPPPCLRFHCFLPPLSPFVSISFSIYSLSYLYISDTSTVFDTAEISRENFIADTLDEAGFVREIDLSEEENEWPGFDFLVTAINRSVIVPT